MRREIVFSRGMYAALGVGALLYLMYELRGVLTPLFLAFLIAYIFDPVVDRFEKWKVPRPLGIAIVMLLLFGGVAAFFALVVPSIVADLIKVARDLPGKAEGWLAAAEPYLTRHGVKVPHSTGEWLEQLKAHSDKLSGTVVAPATSALKLVVGGTFSVIGATLAALIVPVFAVYLLNDFDRIVAGAHDLIPHRFRPTVSSYAGEIDSLLSQFLRGQLTVMAILAVLYGGAYLLLGVRLAVPIGIAAGVLNFIPYVGSAFALVAGLIMSVLGGGGWGQIIGVVAAYAVIQSLEGFVITPRIVGTSVGLNEIWVMVALFVGGELFGFLGVLLAVPGAVVIKVFVGRAVARYRATELFLSPAEALAAATGPPQGELASEIIPVAEESQPRPTALETIAAEADSAPPNEPPESEPDSALAAEPSEDSAAASERGAPASAKDGAAPPSANADAAPPSTPDPDSER